MAVNHRQLLQDIAKIGFAALLASAAALAPAHAAPPPAAPAPYHYQNVTFIAGGFITGFVASPSVPGLYYVRTDIGGSYRWDDGARHWVPLLDWLPFSERNLLGSESIALDPTDPAKLYIAAGTYVNDRSPDGAILRSSDQGRHFEAIHVPFKMGGNEDGRFAGERLQVDPNHPHTLLVGTRQKGLWRSDDSGITWAQVTSFPAAPANNDGLTFVTFDKSSGTPGQPTPVVFVGVDDPVNNLMRSNDGGKSWQPVTGGPHNMFPNHGVLSTGPQPGLLYLSYGDNPGPNGMTNGAVWTYAPRSGKWADITPEKPGTGGQGFGYGTVTLDPEHPQTVIASTMDRWHPGDTLFRSTDGGQHWASLKEGSSRDSALAPWTKHTAPEAPFGHWLGAAMIDPFHPGHVLYGTGETIWESHDVGGPAGTAPAQPGEPTHWAIGAPGLEETADIMLLSPLLPGTAEPHLYTGLGDIGCFRNDDPARSPQGGAMKNPELSNCDSMALAARQPQQMVRVGRSWNPGPHGAFSHDGGLTWKPFATEPGDSQRGERGGDAALSADGKVAVWALRGLAGPSLFESGDQGEHWQAFPVQAEGQRGLQVVADATRPESFWVFDSGAGALYRVDSATGTARLMTRAAPKNTRLRIAANNPSTLWLAGQPGLFRAPVPAGNDGIAFAPVPTVTAAYAVGFGKAAPQSGPSAAPAIYLAGKLANSDEKEDALGGGIYRSLDNGTTWQRIDNPEHRFAWVEQITGDPRVFGRVYLGTNGRGVLEGEPQP